MAKNVYLVHFFKWLNRPLDFTVSAVPGGWLLEIDWGIGMRPERTYPTLIAASEAGREAVSL
jgi:hypothetical protein